MLGRYTHLTPLLGGSLLASALASLAPVRSYGEFLATVADQPAFEFGFSIAGTIYIISKDFLYPSASLQGRRLLCSAVILGVGLVGLPALSFPPQWHGTAPYAL